MTASTQQTSPATEGIVRRGAAEAAGTATLCAFGFGGATAAAETGGGLLLVALAWGLGLAVAIYAFAGSSGAHLNPTVTLVLAARGAFAWRDVPAYLTAQVIGATAAGLVVAAAYGSAATDAGLGAARLGTDVSVAQGLLAETLAGFFLLIAVAAMAVDHRAPKGLAGAGIGVTLAAVILMLGPVAGASINAARTFGPELVLALTGNPSSWTNLWLYLVGPVLGGLAAVVLYDWLHRSANRQRPDGRQTLPGQREQQSLRAPAEPPASPI